MHRVDGLSCDECLSGNFQDNWELFGCGWKEEYAGTGLHRTKGADCEPYNKTCENFYWEQMPVQMVLADLEDYRRGALGSVWDLPAPHLTLLRIADSEESQWSSYYHARMMEVD